VPVLRWALGVPFSRLLVGAADENLQAMGLGG